MASTSRKEVSSSSGAAEESNKFTDAAVKVKDDIPEMLHIGDGKVKRILLSTAGKGGVAFVLCYDTYNWYVIITQVCSNFYARY